MKVKIDEKLICIPPYISTTWDQISFLQSEEDPETGHLILALHLKDGKSVRIPKVDPSIVDIAFAAHIKFLESKVSEQTQAEPTKAIGNLLQQLTGLSPDQLSNMPIKFGISGVEGISGMEALQHNSAYGNAPDMPAEILDKISGMIKMLSNGEVTSFPKPELHCNCPHCQVARSVHNIEKEPESPIDQPVPDEDLRFRDWEIVKKGDKLYSVINLESKEEYSVFLGTPIGCTCGNTNCDHIKAVLYTYL